MQYYYTEYPFAFIKGQNRYDIPFSIKFDDEPLTSDKREFFKVSYDPPLYTDTEYYNYTINKVSGNADLYYAMQYKIISDTTEDISFYMSLIICSSAPFSASINRGVKYVGTDYSDSGTTVSNPGEYTYSDKTIYYYVYKVTYSLNKTDGTFNWYTSTELNANDWAVYYNIAEKYFAWLIKYGDNLYINDPYNRPPNYGDDEQRGGDGDWDISSDTVVDPALPAGLWGQGFVSVYCPTTAELQTFANKIWDKSIRSELNDIFPNGITSGIVDCFTIPVLPDTTTSGIITMGDVAIPSTSAAILANRFKEVNFGTINLGEHFGGFPDYLCTKIAIYLPYIGWEQLAPEMVLRCSLNLKYKIDCLTGDFVAVLMTNRDDKFKFDGVSYTFQGNCASRIPITAQTGAGTSDYISAAISGIGAIAGSFVSGNPIPAVMGAANTINSMMSMNDKHTFALKGGFSGSKGQLTSQRPYLVINRPIMENNKNNNYFNLCGVPSNDYAQVSSCSGFTKALEVELQDSNFAGATEKEKSKICDLLKRGIYI